jgi:hypothetical protein
MQLLTLMTISLELRRSASANGELAQRVPIRNVPLSCETIFPPKSCIAYRALPLRRLAGIETDRQTVQVTGFPLAKAFRRFYRFELKAVSI